MQGYKKERWFQLCQQASVEQDSGKMLELITEINDLLEEKEKRLEAERITKSGADGERLNILERIARSATDAEKKWI